MNNLIIEKKIIQVLISSIKLIKMVILFSKETLQKSLLLY